MLFLPIPLLVGQETGKSDLGRVRSVPGYGGYLDLDIMQNQGDIRLTPCTTGGFPCQNASRAIGYAETVE